MKKQKTKIVERIVEVPSASASAAWLREQFTELAEAYTQADIELALDDRGWMTGGKAKAGELDPLARTVQVNRSRLSWLRDPLAKQAIRLWTDYGFGGDAMTVSCDDTAVQSSIEDFMKDRRNRNFTNRAGQRRLSQKLLVDGDIFFAIWADGTIRNFDCQQIQIIITDPDDVDTILGYKRVTTPDKGSPKTLYYADWTNDSSKGLKDPENGNNVTFEKGVVVYHLPFDNLDKWGNPLFGSCSQWSTEYRRFMEARVAITQALSTFAFKSSVKGGQKIVDGIKSKMESSMVSSGLNGGTEHNPPPAKGSTFLSNEGMTLEAMPRTTGASEAKVDADTLKLQVSAGTGIMLHYFGDPSTGNLATATAMELPMLKMFGAYQQLWKDAWRDIFSIVLDESPDDEAADIKIELPSIIEDDLGLLGTFLGSLTAAFPESKVPEVLEQCLVSMNIPNVQAVMKAIADNKKIVDAQAKVAADNQHQQAMALATAKPGLPVPPAKPAPQEQSEAERMDKLTAAISQLAEVMR